MFTSEKEITEWVGVLSAERVEICHFNQFSMLGISDVDCLCHGDSKDKKCNASSGVLERGWLHVCIADKSLFVEYLFLFII